MSFKDISFNYNDYNGMTLVTGKNNDIPGSKNAAGKSNLFSALVYTLFGDLPNTVKKQNIPNRMLENNEGTELILNFDVGNNSYIIKRGLKPKSRAAYCEVYKEIKNDNGEKDLQNLTKSSIILTQDFINKEILKTDISMFLRAILMTTDQTYNFFKLTASQKREFIENLFGLNFYTEIYQKLHKTNLAYDKELSGLELVKTNLEKTLNTCIANIEEFNKNKDIEKQNALRNIEETSNELLSLNELYNKLVDSNKLIQTKVTELNNKRLILNENISKATTNENKLTKEIYKIESNIKSLTKQIELFKDVQNLLCSDCLSKYNKYVSFDTIKDNILKYENALKETKTTHLVLADKQAKLMEKLNELDSILEKLTDKQTAITNKLHLTKSEINSKNTIVSNLQQAVKKFQNDNPYNNVLETTKSQISEIDEKISDLTDKLKYLAYAETVVSQDTIRKFIVKDMLSLLNTRISYYLNKVGATYTCEFDENMDYTFITNSGEADYNNFSSGERMRLAIATSFAFRDFMATRSGITSNLLILDEYIDGNIDSLGINGIISILKEFLLLYGQKIYVISHRSEVAEEIFNNKIIVEKTNGISELNITKE
jgi:DNA repair exonuclease SbcCD ATPase subunit